jgi:hypothetical protein
MAELLHDNQSIKAHLSAAQRHIRLCRQVPGTESLVTAIIPFESDLQNKHNLKTQAIRNREAANDTLILKDALLDNQVRTLFDKAKEFDRDNPGQMVLKALFPDEKFTTITNAPLQDEPTLARQLLVRLDSLGGRHQLAAMKPQITAAIEASETAQTNFVNSIKEQKNQEALEEIAKASLRKQYEVNFYIAGIQFGKAYANLLFPVMRSGKSASTEPAGEEPAK